MTGKTVCQLPTITQMIAISTPIHILPIQEISEPSHA
jgi:hypothetical protein